MRGSFKEKHASRSVAGLAAQTTILVERMPAICRDSRPARSSGRDFEADLSKDTISGLSSTPMDSCVASDQNSFRLNRFCDCCVRLQLWTVAFRFDQGARRSKLSLYLILPLGFGMNAQFSEAVGLILQHVGQIQYLVGSCKSANPSIRLLGTGFRLRTHASGSRQY